MNSRGHNMVTTAELQNAKQQDTTSGQLCSSTECRAEMDADRILLLLLLESLFTLTGDVWVGGGWW